MNAIEANDFTLEDVAMDIVMAGLQLQSLDNVEVTIVNVTWITVPHSSSRIDAFATTELMIAYEVAARSEEVLDIVSENMDESIGSEVVIANITLELASNEFVSVAPTEMPTPSPTRRPKKCSADSDCRKNMICDVYNGVCVEPTPTPTKEETGCCMADSAYASSKWKNRCKEATSETVCLRYGRGTADRCEWKSGPHATCDDEPVETGTCVWNQVGKGDPDRLNKQCSRLEQHVCETGGPKGICMWITDGGAAKRRVLVDLNGMNGMDGMDGTDETDGGSIGAGSLLAMIAPSSWMSKGLVMDHQMLILMAMTAVTALFALHQLCRKCKQRGEKMKYDGYTSLPEATDNAASSYFSMTQSV